MGKTHTFSKGEELANAITHGIGALLSVAGLVFLIIYATLYGTALHIVSFTIFGVTMVMLYFSSTILHALPEGKVKDLFEIFDHSSIYLFIAGSYTPLTLIVIKGALGWTIFGVIWGLAIGGIVFKAFFVKKYLFTSTILYVLMGWLIIIGWGKIVQNLHFNGVVLLVVGGLFYTLGAIFYVWRAFKYHHAVWHLFVVLGSIAHFFCIILYLLPT